MKKILWVEKEKRYEKFGLLIDELEKVLKKGNTFTYNWFDGLSSNKKISEDGNNVYIIELGAFAENDNWKVYKVEKVNGAKPEVEQEYLLEYTKVVEGDHKRAEFISLDLLKIYVIEFGFAKSFLQAIKSL